MGGLAEEAVKQTLDLGHRIASALQRNAEPGVWLVSPDVDLGLSLSPELTAFALSNAVGADAPAVGNKLAFLVLSAQSTSAVGQLIADVAAKAFRRAGAALNPYLDADDLSSLLRWRLWKLEASYFNPARILKHPGLAAYISVIARRIVIDEARALSKRSRSPLDATELETAVDPRATMDAVLDDLDLLRRFAASVPAWQAPIVDLLAGTLERGEALSAINQARGAEGLSSWTPESLRTGIHRARSRLRELLDEPPPRPTLRTPTTNPAKLGVHRWRRFWSRPEQSYSLDDGDRGFLIDPEAEHGQIFQANAIALDRLDDSPCLALLGEPGIGKSTTLQQERQRLLNSAHNVTFVDLARITSPGVLRASLAPAFMNSPRPTFVIIDGLDEALARYPSLSSELAAALQDLDTARTRLRISCRTLEWPADLEADLRKQWGSDAVQLYELLPLRRDDVNTAASDFGLDANAFIECVRERDATSLAIRPISLRFLLEMYLINGELPRSKARLFDEGSLILCSEEAAWQRGRGRGNADVFRRRAIAARLAALSTFTNSQTIDRAPQPADDTLPASAAIGGTETTASATYVVDAAALEDVLTGTALFTARTGTTFGWSHQTYREFLAAWYLAQHNVGDQVMTTLYFPNQRSRVPTPLREVAAWHAAFTPAMFDLLLERDPEVLLHSDGGAAAPESRAQLTDVILTRMARFEAIDNNYWPKQYRGLKHAHLAEQLRPYIHDKEANIIVRRASMDIAWACAVTGVIDDLIAVLRDPDDDLQARECAVSALGQLAGQKVHTFFFELLDIGFEPDPNDSIRGSLLDCMWPDHLDAPSLFRAMPVPKREDYSGTYQGFIGALPGTLKPVDIPSAISWIEQLNDDTSYDLEITQQAIIDLALRNLGDRHVVEPLCRLIHSSLRSHSGSWRSPGSGRGNKRPELSTSERRVIIDELLRTAYAEENLGIGLLFSRPPLLAAEDIEWLAHKAATETTEVARACGALVALLYQQFGYPTDLTVLDTVVSIKSAAFREPLAPLIEPVPIDSDTARALKERWQRGQRQLTEPDEDTGDDEHDEPTKWNIVAPHLEKAGAGDQTGWIAFVYGWSPRLPKAIAALPDWSQLPHEVQHRVISAALRFINESDAPDLTWLDKSRTFPLSVIAARSALQLISDVRPPLLDQISEQAWRRWCPVLVGVVFPEIRDETRMELHRRCNEHAADELNAAIVRIVRRDNRDDVTGLVFRELPRPASCGLQASLLPVLGELKDQAFEAALELLVESGNTLALQHGVAVLRSGSPARAARVAQIVLLSDAAQWPTVIARMQQDRSFAEAFASLVSHTESLTTSLFSSLSERPVAELFLTLYRHFPPEPGRQRRGGLLTAVDHIFRLRDRMIRGLVDRGTDAGIAALEWLIEQEPDHQGLRWHLVEAKQKHSDTAWRPLSTWDFWRTVGFSVQALPDGALHCSVTLREAADLQEIARQLRAAVPGLKATVSSAALSIAGLPHAIAQLQEVVERIPTLRDAILSVRVDKEWLFEAIPAIPPVKPMTRDVSAEELQRLFRNVHILLLTATDLETQALLGAMDPLPGELALVVGSLDIGTYTVGKLGSYVAAHLQSDIGPEGPNAAPLATSDAIHELKPKLVLLVGIAFGINRSRQRLGDVLAAQHVTSYEMVKLNPQTIDERGETLHGNTILCERVNAHKRNWELLRADGSQVNVHVGQVLSGTKLVNNREFRDYLARRFPAALGGEMEGIGVYAAAFRRNVPVFLVKAICDWADGLKNERAQPFAAAAAVSLVRHVLSKPGALKALEIPTAEADPDNLTRVVE